MYLPEPYAMNDLREVRRLITHHGWALLVTQARARMAATHLPCLLDPELDPGGRSRDLVILGHIARVDPQAASVRAGDESLLVFQGPQGYISPAWYDDRPAVPTWNYLAVHVWGRPERLDGDAGFEVLTQTVEHFEAPHDYPWRVGEEDERYARSLAADTQPFRLRATRIEAKAKLSQDKPAAVRQRVIDALQLPGPYQQRALAQEMRRALEGQSQP